jgi:predicted ATPase
MLTDIQGSSDLHQRFPDEMFDLMESHDDILLKAIESSGGELFKHTGDGAWAAFPEPLQAITAAINIQTGISHLRIGGTNELSLRIGINSGQARRRRGDYFGPAVVVTARLEAAANGRQILVGGATRKLLDTPAGDIGFEYLGEHRFKGIQPMDVFQVLAPGLESKFGPLGGKREASAGNLPAELTSFIGRKHEVEELANLATTNRVTTILGPGGMGKTRLSIKVAESLTDAFYDGKFLIDLSALEPDQDVWPAFTAALMIPPVADATPRVQVIDHLRESETLLVVDNCEHVLDAISTAITELVTQTTVQIIATSRHVLSVAGEAIYDLEPLDEAGRSPSATNPAIELFIDRAKMASRSFDPSESDLEQVALICQGVDYLPLGIEIAAANVRRLDLAQIHQRTHDPLALKASRHRRAIGRQQTLRETLEWSYALIDPVFTDILDILCVFSGAFVYEVAEDLCTSLDVDPDDFSDAIDELMDASLLSKDPSDPDRFRILQTVRAFGRERLETQGRNSRVEDAHGQVCARRIATLCDRYDSAEERIASEVLYQELPDMRAAFDRALEADLALAGNLTAPLFFFSYVHRGAEYGNWSIRLLDKAASDDLQDAPVICAAAAVKALHGNGRPQAAGEYLRRGNEALARGANPSRGWLAGVAGQMAYWSDDYEASLAHHLQAAADAQQHDNKTCRVVSLSLAAFSAAKMLDAKQANQLVNDAGAAGEEASNPSAIGYSYFARGMLAMQSNPKLALQNLQAASEWAGVGGNRQGAIRSLRFIADLKASNAEPEEALQIQSKALLNFPERGDTIHSWSCLESLFKPLFVLHQFDEVAVLAGATDNSPITISNYTQALIEKASVQLGEQFLASRARGKRYGLKEVRAHVRENYLEPETSRA